MRGRMGCSGDFDVWLNCVCWPNMVPVTYTALRCAEAYPCVLLVGGGLCRTGFRGRWEQWAVGSDGSAETEITADCELQPASSCIRVSVGQQLCGS